MEIRKTTHATGNKNSIITAHNREYLNVRKFDAAPLWVSSREIMTYRPPDHNEHPFIIFHVGYDTCRWWTQKSIVAYQRRLQGDVYVLNKKLLKNKFLPIPISPSWFSLFFCTSIATFWLWEMRIKQRIVMRKRLCPSYCTRRSSCRAIVGEEPTTGLSDVLQISDFIVSKHHDHTE